MANIRVTWDLPTVTPNNHPILHTLVEMRVDPSLPWASAGNPVLPTDVQELLSTDLAPGTYHFRVTPVDTADTLGTPAEASTEIVAEVLGSVTNLVLTVE